MPHHVARALRVGIVGGFAPYREALAARLDGAGWETVAGSDRDALIICCTTEDHWCEAADNALWMPTVIVIPEFNVSMYRRALALGAAAVHVDNPTDIVFDVLQAAISGESLLPMPVSQQLALETTADFERVSRLNRIEIEISIRRKLQGIYIKLGVSDRRAAIEALRQRGPLDRSR